MTLLSHQNHIYAIITIAIMQQICSLAKPSLPCPVHMRSVQLKQMVYIRRSNLIRRSESEDISTGEASPMRSSIFQNSDIIRVSAAILAYIGTGVGNRVTYKMALVPLKDYIFFIAQLLSFVYIAVYCSILYFRYKSGIVTDEMLSISKTPFAFIGFYESVASLFMLASAARLPGVILPILQPLVILWNVIVSSILLKTKYSVSQLLGVGLIVIGSSLASQATVSSSAAGSTSIFFILLMNLAFALYAFALVTKDKVFRDTKEVLKGKNLDLFVVNSYSSIAQAIGVFLLFPFILKLKNVTLQELPKYLLETATCFCGMNPTAASNCAGAPIVILSYILFNLSFNISGLYLVQKTGAVITSICSSIIVPTAVAIFSLSLPFLGPGTDLSIKFVIGTAVLVAGMLTFSQNVARKIKQPDRKTS